MKNLIILSIGLLFSFATLSGQVFNTSSTLKPGKFSAGFEPGIYINGGNDFNLFLHAGAGIARSIDFGIKLGVLGNNIYFGGDVEFSAGKLFSFSAGAHTWDNFGLDAMGLFTLPIGPVKLYTGLDLDIVFLENDTEFPLWIPIGLEIPIRRNILFMFETEINVTQYGRHFIGGGLNFII